MLHKEHSFGKQRRVIVRVVKPVLMDTTLTTVNQEHFEAVDAMIVIVKHHIGLNQIFQTVNIEFIIQKLQTLCPFYFRYI